ncbi:MAG TPA: YigZ family protein [Thermaerobacter sp.]
MTGTRVGEGHEPLEYRTVARPAVVETVIRRSRFITHVQPVSSREEAEAWIAEVAARHARATHNVPAYIVGLRGELRWCSDAGEPAGTAGRPVLEVLEREGLTQVAVVVTRYFGGVKLGAAGLVRAYAACCAAGVAAARPGTCVRGRRLVLHVPYGHYGAVRHALDGGAALVLDERFAEQATLQVWVPETRAAELYDRLVELSAGAVRPEETGYEYRIWPPLPEQPPSPATGVHRG